MPHKDTKPSIANLNDYTSWLWVGWMEKPWEDRAWATALEYGHPANTGKKHADEITFCSSVLFDVWRLPEVEDFPGAGS